LRRHIGNGRPTGAIREQRRQRRHFNDCYVNAAHRGHRTVVAAAIPLARR
jgi:hypothetical protein